MNGSGEMPEERERITLAVIARDIKALNETMQKFLERFEAHQNDNHTSFQRQGERLEAMRMEIAVLKANECNVAMFQQRISNLEADVKVLQTQVANTERLKGQISGSLISNVISILFAAGALVTVLMK